MPACPQCGKNVPEHRTSCLYCGTATVPQTVRACPKCRKNNGPNAANCVFCGANMSGGSVQPAAAFSVVGGGAAATSNDDPIGKLINHGIELLTMQQKPAEALVAFKQALTLIDLKLKSDPNNARLLAQKERLILMMPVFEKMKDNAPAKGAAKPAPPPLPPPPPAPPRMTVMTIGPDEKDPLGAIRRKIDEVSRQGGGTAAPSAQPATGMSAIRRKMAEIRGEAVPGGGAAPDVARLCQEAYELYEQKRYDEALARAAQAEQNDTTGQSRAVKGLIYWGMKRWAEAVTALEAAVKYDPSEIQAWFYLADSLDNLNRADYALTAYDKVVQLDPGHLNAWIDRGHVLNKLGRKQDALESWNKAIAIKSDSELAWFNKAGAEMNLLRFDDAIKSFQKARSLILPGANDALEKRIDELIERCKTGKAAPPANSDIQAVFNRAREADKQNRQEEAIALYDEVIRLAPDSYTAWFNKGVCHENLNRQDEALKCYDQALALKRDDARAWGQRGVCLMRMNRLDDALESLNKSLAYDATSAFALVNKGVLLRKLNRDMDALATFEQVLMKNPGDLSAWFNTAELCEKLGELQDAFDAWDRCIRLAPMDAKLRERYEAAKAKLGK